MPNLNRVMLMGHLTRDPETKTVGGGTTVGNIGLAVSRKWKDTNGEQKEETCFVDCEAWGKTAEAIAQYHVKGDAIYLEGRLKLDQWEDKDGSKRSKIRVVVENFQFIKQRSDDAKPAPAPARQPAPSRAPSRQGNTTPFMDDASVPF